MKIPEKVKIGNRWYKVELLREIPNRFDMAGFINYGDLIIQLTDNYSDTIILEHLLHEIVHGMLHEMDETKLNENEHIVTLLARQLYVFLTENYFFK